MKMRFLLLTLFAAVLSVAVSCGSQYPLHEAVKDYDTNRIAELIRSHAEVNLQDRKGNTPLHYATVSRKMTELLILGGAAVNLTNSDGETPLHLASFGSEIGSVALLLSNGADPNIADKDGNTPLHLAVGWSDEYSVRELLAFGANLSATNRAGYTPYDLAVQNDDSAIIALLNGATNGFTHP